MGSEPDGTSVTTLDRRMMAAAIRLSKRNTGRTASNPSVATLIVRDEGNGAAIVGRGVTALGGRPHAETVALDEAGEAARGATAYVTLEPCAHHGRTPPCARALVEAGVSRVVVAATDPDPRVSGRGYAILREAGITVETGVLAEDAAHAMADYLTQRVHHRPHVTLKLAVSADGAIGRRTGGQVAVTGALVRAQVHLLRARSHAVLVGIGTVLADDPELTCRIEGLKDRSPIRVVLDRRLRTPPSSKLVRDAGRVPLWLASTRPAEDPARRVLAAAGVRFPAVVGSNDAIALPELLEDFAAAGIQAVMVEGGAETARSFLAEDLVDRIALYTGAKNIGGDTVTSPVTMEAVPEGFVQTRFMRYGGDEYREYERIR
ncbi:bifunctional diaminohydroxyphosphoribosylaminopyrimidine deaminase/5-amino-6-(5-phosphoribosylamino)uracil reductase RibD [Pararhizobium mangrovi]|uniref:Riboflavin biosynthesis protein RibD n=1 Tax=Pararhizobium mangrovi TaxID=2590452 RepID=A0A506UEI9_9HYPH|nr:bifunctional diaminohydroxyphosphoribosylaminopyrimidine deaminase/5-amino-6-(5-phosphoribosylamino)uracil reductase RibD [Pararhizobium mangrovi]TPW31866.1 bifunctional diaminohydroxyphosphoribosylaminopyrimidine deaminase/5-amino-6-(5-phosphoribosylamino)uracil reductase RibD [Pararhizobium mangrovi]